MESLEVFKYVMFMIHRIGFVEARDVASAAFGNGAIGPTVQQWGCPKYPEGTPHSPSPHLSPERVNHTRISIRVSSPIQ